MIARIVISEQD